MIRLNLAYPERSNINFNIINFPDGHKHIVFDQSICKVAGQDVDIIFRFRSMDDLFVVEQASQIISKYDGKLNQLHFPYLYAGRCDRAFSLYECVDLNLIIGKLNLLGFSKMYTHDTHIVGGINNIYNINWVVDKEMKHTDLIPHGKVVYSYPDESAFNKYRKYNLENTAYAVKHRDVQGRITSMHLETNTDLNGKIIYVRDDLIDGGATFIEFAKLLKNAGAEKLILFVTHAIFSKGIDCILEYYDSIYCTNSYQDIEHPRINCYDVY
jgi:ribose-phosphate pyrophosphokinase